MTEFNLFGKSGGDIRHDISEAELLSLDEPRREIVFEILADHEAELAADAERTAAEKAFYARVSDLRDEESERDALGRTTFLDERNRTIKARQRAMGIEISTIAEPTPPDQKAIAAANLRVEKAMTARDAARVALTNADLKLREAKAKIAASLMKYVNPVSFADMHKQAMAAHQERKEREAPVFLSPLDAQMSGGRSYSANVGYGRKHMRRAHTRVHTGR